MKTFLIRTMALSLVLSIMLLHSTAQKTNSKNENGAEFSFSMGKKTPSLINKGNVYKMPEDIPFNSKVLNEFNKKFLDASNVSWSFAPNGTYHAFFKKDGILNAILLNKNGKIIYLINYGSAKHLPVDIKELVKDSYPEYQIDHIVKIAQSGGIIWIINLSSLNHIVFVRVRDGILEEVHKYEKG